MIKRTTIELDMDLLHRAKQALGQPTTRGAVEAALRRATESIESERTQQAGRQRRYFDTLSSRIDLAVLAAEDMWR